MAPRATAIYAYGAGTETNINSSPVNALNKVADQDRITVLAVSCGYDETLSLETGGPQALADENTALERCAAEGISVCASSADSGAYGDLGAAFRVGVAPFPVAALKAGTAAATVHLLILNTQYSFIPAAVNKAGGTYDYDDQPTATTAKQLTSDTKKRRANPAQR